MDRRIRSAFALGMALLPFLAAAQGPRFSDVPADAWYATYVEKAADAGIVTGYVGEDGQPTGLFGPADKVTLEQALKMVLEAAGYEETVYEHACGAGCGGTFSATPWAHAYATVAMAERFDVLRADKVNLRRAATRAEVAQLVADAFRPSFKLDTIVPETFSDVDLNNKDHHEAAVNSLVQDGIMSGDGDCEPGPACPKTTFRPADTIIRAEVAKVVTKAIEKYGKRGDGMQPTRNAFTSFPGEVELWYFPSQGFVFPNGEASVRVGTDVRFVNRGKTPIWIASDPHPTHDALPGFDAKGQMSQNESFTFMFTKTGTWAFHNEMNPGNAKAYGQVDVE